MKKELYRYILTAAVAFVALGAGAQMKTSYFMEGSIPRYDMNAALTPMHGYVNLPLLPLGAFGINMNNNFLSVDNFIYPMKGGGHMLFLNEAVDAKKFLRRIPNRASLNVDMNYNLLGFGKYNRKHDYFWSFGWNLRTIFDIGVPKELFSILKDLQNGLYDIPDVTVGATAYSEFAFGFTMPVWESLVVGGRLKFLVGLAQAEAAFNNVSLDVTKDQVKATLGGSMRASVFGMDYANLQPNSDGGLDFNELMDFGRYFGIGNAFKSYGAAIDIGAEMKFFDNRLKASFALNDLGFICWSGANSVYGKMDDVVFEFKGYNLDTGEDGLTKPEEIGDFRQEAGKGYTKRLSTTMNIGAEYNFFDNLLGVGVLSHTKFSNRVNYTELTVAGTVRPAKWFTASISHSLVNNKIGIFGFALNFHPRGINFFLGLDYIPSQFARIDRVPVPLRMKSFNTYFGLAFTPGGRSKPWK